MVITALNERNDQITLQLAITLTNSYAKPNVRTKKSQAMDIEHIATDNPNEFWRKIENLGPRKDKSIQMEIVDSC